MLLRYLRFAFIVFFLLTTNAYSNNDVWESLQGPFGGSIYSIAIDPANSSIIYAGSSMGGIYKSIDSGANWTDKTGTMLRSETRSVIVNPDNPQIIYALQQGGLYRSDDSAESWIRLDMQGGLDLDIDPQNPDILYAATTSGVSKTIDGGNSWFSVNTGIESQYMMSVAVDPNNSNTIYAGAYFNNSTSGGIFKSVDAGATWTAINNGLAIDTVNTLKVDPADSNKVYAGLVRGLYITTDGGENWVNYPIAINNIVIYEIAVDPSNTDNLYITSFDGAIARSTNGGINWAITDLGGAHFLVLALAIDPVDPSILYAGSRDGGIVKSVDAGASWQSINDNLINSSLSNFYVHSTSKQNIYARGRDVLYKSTDEGLSWTTLSFGTRVGRFTSYVVIEGETDDIIMTTSQERGVATSRDGGITWTETHVGLPRFDTATLAVDPQNSEIIYCAVNNQITFELYKSINQGSHWQKITTQTMDTRVEVLLIDPDNTLIMYAGTWNGIYKSVDGGVTWMPANNNLRVNSQGEIGSGHDLKFHPTDSSTIFAVVTSGVYKTTNSADNWEFLGKPSTFPYTIEVDSNNPDILYLSGSGFGVNVHKSTDGGQTWLEFNNGIEGFSADIALDPNNHNILYAGTGGGGAFKIVQSIADEVPDEGAPEDEVPNEGRDNDEDDSEDWGIGAVDPVMLLMLLLGFVLYKRRKSWDKL